MSGKTNLRSESFPSIKLTGERRVVGDTEVTVLMESESNGETIVMYAAGPTVPSDAETGYGVGCLFIDTDAGVGTTMYVNEGDVTSCDFNAIT